MLRTRDYFLLLVVIIFLLVAIGTTAITRTSPLGENGNADITFGTESPTEFSAEISGGIETTRSERLFALREKIQTDSNLSLYAQPEPEEVPVAEEVVPENNSGITEEIRCPQYAAVAPAWNTTGVKVEVIEGLRLVYRENQSPPQAAGTSSVAVSPSKDILLKLPVRTASQGSTNCIPSTVIGVTIGGSLIKNSDAGLYAPFGEGTILGYALDGYPIYGTSAAAVDACGGRTVGGQYRYQLSADRETILNCFSGLPVSL